ncbi:MAG: hypothetical protein CL930_15510 [Deltaproteobacteria bacterium]|nr:hypothetical protein [Deltaproteobacteria bacterium]
MLRFPLLPCLIVVSACATDKQVAENAQADTKELIDATYASAAKEAGPSSDSGDDGAALGQWLVELAIDEMGQMAAQHNCEVVGALGGRWTQSNLQYRARIFDLDGSATDNVVGRFIFNPNQQSGVIKGRTSRRLPAEHRVRISGEFVQNHIEADILYPPPKHSNENGERLTLFGEWNRTPQSAGGHMLGVVARCN